MTGSGTVDDPYVVYDVNDLQLVGNTAPYSASAYYELANDIDATATSTWNWSAGRGVYEGLDPIGTNFAGNFDGKFYTIDGVYVNRIISYAGLFRYVTTGTVDNVYVSNVDITASRTGNDIPVFAGGLAGRLSHGTVTCCFATGTVSGSCQDTLPTTFSYNSAGGLIGHQYGSGTIDRCGASVTVETTAINFAHASAGGLVGFVNGGTVLDSFARGNATANGGGNRGPNAGGLIGWGNAGTCRRSFSTGIPVATGYGASIGGLIASRFYGMNTYNSFWDTETSGISSSAGGTGKTTAEMKSLMTYLNAGWDFVTVWMMLPTVNNGYPMPRCIFVSVGERPFTFPDLLDDHGRRVKNAIIKAYRADTHTFVEEETTDENGSATFNNLPFGQDIIFHATWGGVASTHKERWFFLDFKDIEDGGTGGFTLTEAASNLGLLIGTDVHLYDADLTTIAGLSHADDNFIVSDGTSWIVESRRTARQSLGLFGFTDMVFDAQEVTDEVAADNTRVSFDMESV